MSGETKSNGRKNKLDKFYTTKETVSKCLKMIDLLSYDCVIEPSAGNGSFSDEIPGCFAYDINPENKNIKQADWLKLDKNIFKAFKNILVIGNPPFGVQNNLAIKFFNESASFCDTIAFILPKSFRKNSIKNKLNLYFHLKKELLLDGDCFLINGKKYSVPCTFQIWEKSTQKRKKSKNKMTTPFFDFIKKNEGIPDIRIQRVGGNAGKAHLSLDGSAQSNYFIRNNTILSNEELVKKINNLYFPNIKNTVGPKSLSKTELIEVIEEELNTNLCKKIDNEEN